MMKGFRTPKVRKPRGVFALGPNTHPTRVFFGGMGERASAKTPIHHTPKCENLPAGRLYMDLKVKCENPPFGVGFRTFPHLPSVKTSPCDEW